ncbi:succinate dehydrogenase, cytochrome b556 subunit [Thiomicrorhabdus sp. 6S3-12]|uniref:succinate dehydrogenase, cytochrome b556 subunit n=1 Tax=Thiomicrorhabdus sp. 6S3-12 TaxID=2819681 RepID=UPI001AACB5AC|nr:succinate dehydrogenase, cytochrome b556 subunit [Thiomicrorhabdus sp. 6S3-12]MBO1924022.1 succinate dehydrogenase, cytochrome b556 subunit [Thiomicrorhabdus sp. 6S3-12]
MYQSNDPRPRSLNLLAFHFPLNAWLSVLHRITGLLLIVSLIGYLALANLIWLHPDVRLSAINQHWIPLCMHSVFWAAVSFHWLTGLRHLLAEKLYDTTWYSRLASPLCNSLVLLVWLLICLFSWQTIWN